MRRTVTLTGIVVTLYVFFPGYMTGDAWWQLDQARHANYNDWHPPVMSFLWHYFEKFVPGSASMFLFHVVLFWIGLGYLYFSILPSRKSAALATLGVGLFPPIFFMMGQVGKDFGMIAALIFGLGLFASLAKEWSWPRLGLASLGFAYGVSLRHNAVLALFPLAYWIGNTFYDRFGKRVYSRWLAGGVYLLILVIAPTLFEARVIRPQRSHISQSVYLFDTVGISVKANKNYLPEFYGRGTPFTLGELKEIFRPFDGTNLFWKMDPVLRHPGSVKSARELAELKAAWWQAVKENPRAYIETRLEVFCAMVGIESPRWLYNYVGSADSMVPRGFNRGVKRAINNFVLGNYLSFWFRAWVYCGVLVVLFACSLLARQREVLLFYGLALSGIVYELGYFPVTSGSELRYSWWAMFTSALVLPLLRWPQLKLPTISLRLSSSPRGI